VPFAVLARTFAKDLFEVPYKVTGIIESNLSHHLFDRKEGCLEQLTGATQPYSFQKSLRRSSYVASEKVSESRIRQIDAWGDIVEANVLFAVCEKIGSQMAHARVNQPRTRIRIGTANGGTSVLPFLESGKPVRICMPIG
jgi:hypothetical protein